MSIMREFKISEQEIMEMPLDELWIKYSWLGLSNYRQFIAIHGKPTKGKGKDSGQASDSQDDRWKSMSKEEQLPGGKIKVTHRVNVMDLWDNPQLLASALSGK